MKNAELLFTDDPKNPKALSLVFKGLLSIENANDFRDQVLKKIEAYEIFNFEINEVEMIDLSFYQLLLAAKKTIQSKNKQFNITMSLPPDRLELLARSGFDIDFK